MLRLKAGLSNSGVVGTQGSLSVAGTNAAWDGGGGSGTGSGAAGDREGDPEEKASNSCKCFGLFASSCVTKFMVVMTIVGKRGYLVTIGTSC